LKKGVVADRKTLEIEVERKDRWIITGLDPSTVYPLHKPIEFSISEKNDEIQDLNQSLAGLPSFFLEIRDPMKNTLKVYPKSGTQVPLEFFVEFTPEYNGVHKITLYYKNVLIGDVITLNAGTRRFGAAFVADYRYGVRPPPMFPKKSQKSDSYEDVKIIPISNVGVQVIPVVVQTPPESPSNSVSSPHSSSSESQKKGWFPFLGR